MCYNNIYARIVWNIILARFVTVQKAREKNIDLLPNTQKISKYLHDFYFPHHNETPIFSPFFNNLYKI